MDAASHYLYKIQPTRLAMLSEGPTSAESAIINQHFAYLKQLTAEGVVILAGRTLTIDEDSFGIVIFKAQSAEHAQEIMEHDPAVQQGVMRATLYPYGLALLAKSEGKL